MRHSEEAKPEDRPCPLSHSRSCQPIVGSGFWAVATRPALSWGLAGDRALPRRQSRAQTPRQMYPARDGVVTRADL